MNYFDLKSKQKQIELQRINIRQLREKAVNITQTITDMPHGLGNTDKDKLGIAISQIDEQENKLKLLELEFEESLCSIPNTYIRRLITCKLKYRWSWTKIAVTLGGNNTGNAIRMMCTRYKW